MALQLKPEDIDTVEAAGVMDGEEIKMCRTKGGWWFAISKGKVISAGSHPAIVKHTVSKMYPNFQPALCKSESFMDAIVDQHSHFLSDELRKSGHDLYSIQVGQNVEFQVTKDNLKVASIDSYLTPDSLHVHTLNIPKEFVKAFAAATTEKALDSNTKKIKVK